MSKVIELANKAGIAFAGYNEGIDEQAPSEGKLQYFYTLARADLEAENAKLKQKMVDGVTIQQYIDLDNECDVLKAENAKLRKALSPFVLANSSEEHMTLIVRTADITTARAALGENE